MKVMGIIWGMMIIHTRTEDLEYYSEYKIVSSDEIFLDMYIFSKASALFATSDYNFACSCHYQIN